MKLLDFLEKIYKIEKKYGLKVTLPLFLIGCGIAFPRLYDPLLLPKLAQITGSFIESTFSNLAHTGSLSFDAGALDTILQTSLKVLPLVTIGALTAGVPSWTVFGASDLVRNAWDTAKIEHDRKETILSNIPKQDRDKVNTKDREKYLSYNNELLRLYAGPDKKDKLIIPEGIESIGPDAFDRFVTEKDSNTGPRIRNDIASIVLPSSIRNLNPANIPRNSTLELIDVTQKIRLDRVNSLLRGRNICVQGGLFTDLLTACKDPDKVSSLSSLPSALIERLINTLNSVKDQDTKKSVLDELHEQVLYGNLTLRDFKSVLDASSFQDSERYEGSDVIKRLYGSVEDVIKKYAESYYQAEKERIAKATPKRKKDQKNGNETKAEKTIEELIKKSERKAKEPLATETEQLKDVPDLKKRRVRPEKVSKAKGKNNKSKSKNNTHGRD